MCVPYEEIQNIVKFYYKKRKNATQAAKRDCNVYGTNGVLVRVAQSWFKRFQTGNFDIKDAPHSVRPVTDKIDAIFKTVGRDRHISSYDVAEDLEIDYKIVRYTKKLNIGVPQELTERNLMKRVLICDSLLKCNEVWWTDCFWRYWTGDENWRKGF